MLLRPDPALVNSDFLYYLLTSPLQQERLLSLATGSTVAHLNVADVRAFHLPALPTVDQQVAIAEVLGPLDDKIAANAKLAAKAEALGKALFQNSISGPEAVSVQLRDVAKNVPGKYLAKDDYVSDGPYFIYGSNSIMGRHDKALNQGGFAVLAKIGSYCGNLRWSQRPAWVNNNASAIVPAIGMAPSVLRHSLDLIEMAPHKAGTGQPYIRMESLFSSEITVPDLETSAVIAPVLDGLSELEARSSEENTTLATTRDALLPQLMSGKIRVKDAEKILEVAGV
jgi:type I restriction enzyme S subunit